MSGDDPEALVERWLEGADDAALAEGLRQAAQDPTQRRALRRALRLGGLLQLAAEPSATTDLAADVLQRIGLEEDGPPFVAQWQRRHGRRRPARRGQRRPARVGLVAAVLVLGLGLGGTLWWALADPLPELVVDGSRRPLHAGLVVEAGEAPRRIAWPARGWTCELAPGGRLRWQGAAQTAQLELVRGAADCRLQRRAGSPPLVMRLPGLALTVTGTRWHCRVDEQGSLVQVASGAVQVTAGRQQRRRRAGEATVVRRDGTVAWLTEDLAGARRALAVGPPTTPSTPATPSTPSPAAPASDIPVLELLPADAVPPQGEALLLLDATALEPFHHIILPESEKIKRYGPGLPGPWSVHNWEDDGRSELFTDTVDGEQVLVLRNVQGHGLMLSQWRPLQIEAGATLLLQIDYRYRGSGQLAIALHYGDSRSQQGLRLPPAGGDWRQVTYACHLPPGDAAQPCTVLFFQQRIGGANDVLLRRVSLAPVE